jgi:glucans biosynthesis protein C
MTSAALDEARLNYMDNLRALAMLAGVLFHAGLAYSVALNPFWPTADAGHSVWVDVVAWFSHLFRMPLFFVVAGFFTALLVAKRGLVSMLRNRFARVLLPFVVFWPITYITMGWLTTHAATNGENLSPLLNIIKQWLATPNQPIVPPTLMHLWFLPYLMCFCVLVWVAITLEMTWLTLWFRQLRLSVLLGVAPLVLVLPLASVVAPFPAPESFFPQWWALVFFGFYFAVGFQLFQRAEIIDKLKPYAPFMLLAAIVTYVIFLMLLKMKNPMWHMAAALLEAYTGFWMTLCSLYYGKKWLNVSNRFLRYLADTSYWVYIVHLPILFAIQYRLLDIETHWQLKFVISVIGTLMIAFLSYHLLVRNTVIGMLLNGQRRKS